MIFLYGTLRHPALLKAVLGRVPLGRPAKLAGHRVVWAEGEPFPMILPDPSAEAEGLLIEPEDRDEQSRLDFYELGFGYDLAQVTVEADGPAEAGMYLPRPGLWQPGADWSLDAWVRRYAGLALDAAQDYMTLWPATPPDRAAQMYPQILQRADSRLRAVADPVPRGIRAGGGEVEVSARRRPYRRYFELIEADLAFPRFDGTLSEEVTRAAFVGGDAVTVLPYDPVRDRVLLIEQFRFPPMVRRDPLPWTLEPIAGRIDGGETPESTAHREAMEEAGLLLGDLIPIGQYYASPGDSTDYIYSFLATADLPDASAGMGGLAEEHEDIRAHLVPFDRLMQMIESGEANNGPLIVSALQLARRRGSLRG